MKQTDQEQQVCDYLKRNPDFFQHHPYVLLELELFSKSQGLPNLALQQLRLLREQNQALNQFQKRNSRTIYLFNLSLKVSLEAKNAN